MISGGCSCRKVRVEYSGEPAAVVSYQHILGEVHRADLTGTVPLRGLPQALRLSIHAQFHREDPRAQGNVGLSGRNLQIRRCRQQGEKLLLRRLRYVGMLAPLAGCSALNYHREPAIWRNTYCQRGARRYNHQSRYIRRSGSASTK